MTKKTFSLISGASALVLIAGLGVYALIASGVFAKEPIMERVCPSGHTETLKVISDKDYRPYSFFGEDNKPTGYDVELIYAIGDEMGVNIDLTLEDWQSGITKAVNGQCQILMTCDYSDTFSGVDSLLKTEPTSSDNFTIFAKNEIKSINDLYNMKIGVMENGNALGSIEVFNFKSVLLYEDNRAVMNALEKGDVDCAIIRNSVGNILLKELEYDDIKGYKSISQSYMCFGIANNDTALVERINNAIEELKKSGEFDKLHDKWLTTFVRAYSFGETIENNLWIVLAAIIVITGYSATIVYGHNSSSRQKAETEKYITLAQSLSNDFECVNLVTIKENKVDDTALLLRISDTLGKCIPGWDTETNFSKRLDLLRDYIVVEEDKLRFYGMTRRETIFKRLNESKAYLVDFRARIDGQVYYYELKFVGKQNKKGEFESFVCGVHNIDEATKLSNEFNERLEKSLEASKRAEQKLAQEKIILKYFLDAFTSAYSVDLLNDSFEILSMNSDFASYFKHGGDRSDMDKFIKEHIHPDDQKEMYRMADKEYITNRLKRESFYNFSIREVFGNDVRNMRCLIVRGIDEYHIASGFMDVTDELKKEKENQKLLEEAKNNLEAANNAKTSFLFNMSHDIRTPMNAIIGYTNMAQKNIDDKIKIADCLSKIQLSSDHLLRLINDVLDMSRVEAGKLTSDIKSVNINEKATEILNIYKSAAEVKNIKITYNEDIKHSNVMVDELHISQIVMNVLGNAVKYTNKGGKVDFTIAELPSETKGYGKYHFIIKDNGIGMTKEFLAKIYDSFTRAETVTNSGIEGTGLGMSIVKRLVDYLDGTIHIDSKPNVGTKVTITFSLKLTDSIDEKDEILDGDVKSLNGKKVLLVEDNFMNQEIAKDILNDLGISVDTANNGIESLEALKTKGDKYYDFILMDIQMPLMDGLTAAKEIRKLPNMKKIPIIAVSANAFEEDKAKSLEAGMNDHIAKPINVSELEKALFRFLK